MGRDISPPKGPEKNTECISFGLVVVTLHLSFVASTLDVLRVFYILVIFLAENLHDDLDIQQCCFDFIKWANCLLHRFTFVLVWFCLICCAAFVHHSIVVHCGI